MKTSIHTLSILAIATSLSYGEEAPKVAKDPQRPRPEKVFKKLDTDKSGSLTLEEFKASPRGQKTPTKAEKHFKRMDADSNGSLSLEEFKAHAPAKGGKKKRGEAPAGQ